MKRQILIDVLMVFAAWATIWLVFFSVFITAFPDSARGFSWGHIQLPWALEGSYKLIAKNREFWFGLLLPATAASVTHFLWTLGQKRKNT